MKLDTNLSAILLIGAVIAAVALSGIAEGQNIGASVIYDVQSHKAYAVATTTIRTLAVQGPFSINLDGFGGTSTGSGSTLVGGSVLSIRYQFKALGQNASFDLGPSFEVIGDRRPGWGLFFGLGAKF